MARTVVTRSVDVTTTPILVFGASPTRRFFLIQNLDTVNFLNVTFEPGGSKNASFTIPPLGVFTHDSAMNGELYLYAVTGTVSATVEETHGFDIFEENVLRLLAEISERKGRHPNNKHPIRQFF